MDVSSRGFLGGTCLLSAVMKGHFSLVRCLVDELGANIHAKAVDGSTAINVATVMGFEKIAKYLMKRGADAANKDWVGYMATSLASSYGHSKMSAELKRKVQCNKPGCKGEAAKLCGACKVAWYCSRSGAHTNMHTHIHTDTHKYTNTHTQGVPSLSLGARAQAGVRWDE